MKRRICLLMIWILMIFWMPATMAQSALAIPESGLIAQAQQLYRAGDLDQALAILRGTLQQTTDENVSLPAYALIGKIFTEQDRYQEAGLYLKRIPAFLRTSESSLLLGISLIKTGNVTKGIDELRPLLNETLDAEFEIRLYRALADATRTREEYLQTLFYLQQLLLRGNDPGEIISEAHDLLQNRIGPDDLKEAAFMWQGTAIGQDARLQLARHALVRQQKDEARGHLEKLFAAQVDFPYQQEADLLWQRTSQENWLNRDTIGVLLPLSGSYASYGELVKRGLELALQQHNQTRLPLRLIYQDTEAEQISAAQLVSTLTDDEKVMAIIGPLRTAGAVDAALRAQREMVPLITLAQTEFLPELGNFIFRDTLTPQQQVQALVNYAMASNHISFSILYPENRLGRQMSSLFRDRLKEAGGELIDMISYPENTTDFRKQIQALMWQDQTLSETPGPLGEAQELEYPLPPFHALFIPDYADRISQIAPQLMFYGIKDVTLLGISGWNSPELISRAGRFLKDAVFVDAFFADSKKPEVQRFIELYHRTYNEEPSILEAQAFDIATVVLQAMDDPAIQNRDDLRKKLSELKNFRGITGTTGFDPVGEAIKKLTLLTIRNGRVAELQQP